jgi:hypothetical protein
VRDVVKAYYDKKNGRMPPQPATAENLAPSNAPHPIAAAEGAQPR